MQRAKAVRIINMLILDKSASLRDVDRRRWSELMKEQARKLLREDIAALGLARDVLKRKD